MLAVGVHENHPHPLMLLLFATGLASGRLQTIAWMTGGVYVANMLVLSGLGRFHGARYMELDAATRAIGGLRMALGVDLTLVLAAINLTAFVLLAGWLGGMLGDRGLQGRLGVDRLTDSERDGQLVDGRQP
jgi:hypothetical protein